jgi:hypothetical protein
VWDLGSVAGVRRAMVQLLPGVEPADADLLRLVNCTPGALACLRRGVCQGQIPSSGLDTHDWEVESLLKAVDFGTCVGVFDPWSGKGAVSRAFVRAGHLVYRNDAFTAHDADCHEDPLQPGLYRRVQDVWPYDAIVTAPWFAALDLALPLASAFAPIVAMLVSARHVTDAPEARQACLRALSAAGRLALILGVPRGVKGRRDVWLVVFASRELRSQLLRAEDVLGGPWVMM